MALPLRQDRPVTYEDLVGLPDHVVGEILAGELHVSPRPAMRHSRAEARVAARLSSPFDDGVGGPGGWLFAIEPELHFARDVLVPDVAGWRRERLPEIPDVPFMTLAPDWVCEILSPSTERIDRVKKLPIYARERVGHVWLLDPIAKTVEAFALDGDGWRLAGAYGEGTPARIVPFDAVEFDLAQFWS